MAGFGYKRKTFGLFNPASKDPFRISRSKIDLFLECPRCFYLDQRLGIPRPGMPAFTLNVAVDALLKKEFDIHRDGKTAHPLMKAYGLDALPFAHERLDEWRDSLRRGISFLHEPTNLFVRGGIDDVWVNPQGELIIVDYKATAKDGPVTLNDKWKDGYKRQMEVYQWLFRKNGFKVSPVGYFVYVNGKTDRKAFDGKLEFDVTLLPYEGDSAWVDRVLPKIRVCLMDDRIPSAGAGCEHCAYTKIIQAEAPHGGLRSVQKPKKKRQPAAGTNTLFAHL